MLANLKSNHDLCHDAANEESSIETNGYFMHEIKAATFIHIHIFHMDNITILSLKYSKYSKSTTDPDQIDIMM